MNNFILMCDALWNGLSVYYIFKAIFHARFDLYIIIIIAYTNDQITLQNVVTI